MPKDDAVSNEVSKEPVFHLSSLRQNCRKLFQVSDSTFAGATHGLDPNKEYSVESIKKKIDDWKKTSLTKKEVK